MTLPAIGTTKKPPAGMPDWLMQQIEIKTGGLRNGRWKRCPRCNELTVQGLDADVAAFTVTVDPTPIQPNQEGWCVINGRNTYGVEVIGKKVIINYRDPYAIGLPSHYRIVPEHVCGHRYPGFLLKRPATGQDEQAPPF